MKGMVKYNMALWCNDADPTTRTFVFSASKASEISDLPTTTERGKGVLSTVEPVAPGSSCYLTNGSMDIYMLDGDTNTWILS